MKRAALCLLVIAAPGCNWLLGIDETLLAPPEDGPPGDAPLPVARLTYLSAVTTAQGGPSIDYEYPAISPPPTVKYGRIAEALTDSTINAAGEVPVPYAYEDSTYRLVYQLANDIPREVHWTPMLNRGPHAIVPLYGRVDRAPIPGPNTTMTVDPPGAPATHVGPRIFTTGVWTESQPVFPVPAGTAFTYNLNSSTQLSGPPGAPDPARGDNVILVDYQTTASCRRSVGSGAARLMLTDGPSSTLSSVAWGITSAPLPPTTNPTFGDTVRVALLAGSSNTAIVQTVIQVGPSPNARMPAFSVRTPQLPLRGPLLLAMLHCTASDITNLPAFHIPTVLVDFPVLANLQLAADRVVSGGPRLTHGFSLVQPVTNPLMFELTIGAAIGPFMLGPDDIGATDRAMLTAGTGPLTLSFTTESVGMPAEYYDIVLHRVTGTSTVPERAYTIIGTSLMIEREILAAASEYVFEIRGYLGAPDVRLADFRNYLPTQSSAVVWTHTFRTP